MDRRNLPLQAGLIPPHTTAHTVVSLMERRTDLIRFVLPCFLRQLVDHLDTRESLAECTLTLPVLYQVP